MEILVIAGLSGSGKTSAVSVLGDSGYIIFDSLPASTIEPVLIALKGAQSKSKVALVIDFVDELEFNSKIIEIQLLCKRYNLKARNIFLDCTLEKLISRFKELRKIHPFSTNKKEHSLEKSIFLEQKITNQFKNTADLVIDTTNLSTPKLRNLVLEFVLEEQTFRIDIYSFGFKNNGFKEADFLFDLRFLPNPFYIPELKPKTGLDDEVYNYVFSHSDAQEFYNYIFKMINFVTSRFVEEGRLNVTIAFGCTGGHHRSVSFARRLEQELAKDFSTYVKHRDVEVK